MNVKLPDFLSNAILIRHLVDTEGQYRECRQSGILRIEVHFGSGRPGVVKVIPEYQFALQFAST